REHVLARVGEVLHRPQHVERGKDEQDPDRSRDPAPLRPQPTEEVVVGCALRTAVGWVGSHPFALLLLRPAHSSWAVTGRHSAMARSRGQRWVRAGYSGPATGSDQPL